MQKDRFSTEQNHPEYPIQKKGQSGGIECPKRGPVSLRKTDRLHDLPTTTFGSLEPMIQYWITIYLFSVTLRDDNVQQFDTRWDEVLLYVKGSIR